MYLPIYLSVCLSVYLSVCLSIYLSIFLSIYLSTLHLSPPSTAARQLFKYRLISRSTHNLCVCFSSIRLSSYSTYFSTLHLSLNLLTSPGLSLCPYRLSLSTRLSTRLPPIITARGPKNHGTGGIHLRPGTLPCKTPKPTPNTSWGCKNGHIRQPAPADPLISHYVRKQQRASLSGWLS